MLAVDQQVNIQDVQGAAERLRPYVHRTPVLRSRTFDAQTGSRAFFKCENFQRGGSFKYRGALNFLLQLNTKERARGVVAFSSGNHAQAVAIAAEQLGVKATIVMPLDAPGAKRDATAAHGATIVSYDRFTQNREEIAARIADETGAVTLPPYDHPAVVAGQGTVALELLEQCPDLDVVVTPLGGGGLLSGCAIATKQARPAALLYGVEPEAGNDWFLSLRANERIAIRAPDTIADGLRTVQPGRVTFPIVRALTDGVLLVSDEELSSTMRFFLSRMKVVVEPSGCAAAAAVLHRKLPIDGARVGLVLSGGNVDLEALSRLCKEN